MKEKERIRYSEVSFTDFINNNYFKLIWKLPVKKLLMENFSINFGRPERVLPRSLREMSKQLHWYLCICSTVFYSTVFGGYSRKIDIFAHYIYK